MTFKLFNKYRPRKPSDTGWNKIIWTIETYLNKLFESNKQVATVTATDAQIIWHDSTFMQYEQFRLNDNFRQYLETSMLLKKVFCMWIKKTSLQKSHKLQKCMQGYTVEFTAANRQFDLLKYL